MGVEFSGVHWFGQVIICAGAVTSDFVTHLVFRGKHQDGDMGAQGVFPQFAGNLIAIHARHHNIQYDQRRFYFDRGLQRKLAGVCSSNFVALTLQHHPDETQCLHIIINDENFFRHADHPS